MKQRIVLLAAALLIAGAGSLLAQVTSPTSSTTNSRFSSPVDDFIDARYYGSVKDSMDKWFAFASWATDAAQLGYAAKIGDLLVSAEYNGTLWQNLWSNNVTVMETDQLFGSGSYKEWRAYNDSFSFNGNPNNRITLLLGTADMGFCLGFYSSHNSFKDEDFVDMTAATPVVYKSFEKEYGNIIPSLTWGMAHGLIDQGIQPLVGLSLTFHRDYQKQEVYYTPTVDDTTQDEQVTKSTNYLQPSLNLGLGGFTFYKADAFKAIVDLDYALLLKLYDNEFSYLDSATNKYKTDKIKGEFTGTTPGSYTENTELQNAITPSLKLTWKSEDSRLALKSKLGLAVVLINSSSTGYAYDNASSSAKQDGTDSKTFIFRFTPSLQLAAQYQIIPEKLTLNMGGSISAGMLQTTTVESEIYDNGTAREHSKSKVTTPSFGSTSTSLLAGVTWNLTKNVFVEGRTGVNTNNGNNDVKLLENVVTFSSILAGLKF
jgi:hypothetical protein